ncbi:M4 family metallopeptidase [Mycolicibacterium tokaiense]|uniref:M4 family metallopeptidase n=1 Tax=Mycolicibacterium tokaiense TaxID=39695 RepID=UPI0011C06B22|nr:M4 family metallopeptidase [Mycolicibacterium tokaiense]BBY89487.1 hypothetical protein MTOK_52690 [Mycolicibacterium tokaiense]
MTSTAALTGVRRSVAVVFAAGLVAAAPGIAAAETESDSAGTDTSTAETATGSEESTPEKPDADDTADADEDAGEDSDDEEADDESVETEPEQETPADDPDGLDDRDNLDNLDDRDDEDGPESEPAAQEAEPTTSPRRGTGDRPDTSEQDNGADTDSEAQPSDAEEPAAEEPQASESEAEPVDTRPAAQVAALSATGDRAEAPVALRRPVTVASMVTDALSWVGLGQLSNNLPMPALPVPRLLEMMWVALRQTQSAWNNQRPTARPTLSLGDDGVVRGELNAVDLDDDALTYTVVTPARFGTVAIAADGTFTYTPRPGLKGITDTFTVTIDDAAGNPPRIYGLGQLLGLSGPTSARISVDVASTTNIANPDVTRPGAVTVQMDTGGRISVISGKFTDTQVRDAAGAAAFLNTFAPVLGAESGFAATDLITVQRVSAATGVIEEFYRLRPSIDGIDVLGSEVVVTTDGAGTVTGLFNYYNPGLPEVDTTADAGAGSAAATLAATRLLQSAGLRPTASAVKQVLGSTTIDTDLMILALDRDTAPTLVWRVGLRPITGANEAAPGAVYYIHANGEQVGTILGGSASVQAASAIARDAQGKNRVINVEPAKWWFLFDSSKLVDTPRNLSTHDTAYGLFGFGQPIGPGNPVTRPPWGFSGSAVSAHANMATAYDYYLAVLGRTSIDGEGAKVVSTIGYSPRNSLQTYLFGYANAFWDPDRQLFGFGNAGRFEAALDIVAHEYTHGVISHIIADGESVLDTGESGALNEAYSDIMGVLIEGKTGSGRWLIGEDTALHAIRNLANPRSVGTGYVAHMRDYYTGSQDDFGEHWNSTIFSHAAYKMMTDSRTKAVSDDLWATVIYQSMYGLGAGAKFVDGRAAIVDAAADYFTDTELQAVKDAFDAVGIKEVPQTAGAEVLILAV